MLTFQLMEFVSTLHYSTIDYFLLDVQDYVSFNLPWLLWYVLFYRPLDISHPSVIIIIIIIIITNSILGSRQDGTLVIPFSLGLFFYREDGGKMFLRNAGKCVQVDTASHPRITLHTQI
jgi:hypothetical protein